VHQGANSFWLKIPNVIYFTDKKRQIFNVAIYDKIIITAKLMLKFSVTAKLENVNQNSKETAKKAQLLN